MKPEAFQRIFLLVLVVLITVLFLTMVRPFLLTILIAAIFSGLVYPAYARLRGWLRGRAITAAAITLFLIVILVLVPLLSLVTVLANQALHVSAAVGPTVTEWVENPSRLNELMHRVPFVDDIEPYRDQVISRLGTLVAGIGNWVVSNVSAATRGTLTFFFHLFLLLYSMFFFLIQGDAFLKRLLYYLPLPHDEEVLLLDRFLDVTKATLKGTLIIGIVQGTLGGLGLVLVGVNGAVFWGTVMVVLSVIPGIGVSLVWIPVAIYLAVNGEWGKAIFLTAYGSAVVGSVDNLLRPRLVGRDTKMNDLLILFSTLGGILMFGIVGFIIGPIIAGLFLTIWEIYGIVFRDYLPAVGGARETKEFPDPTNQG